MKFGSFFVSAYFGEDHREFHRVCAVSVSTRLSHDQSMEVFLSLPCTNHARKKGVMHHDVAHGRCRDKRATLSACKSFNGKMPLSSCFAYANAALAIRNERQAPAHAFFHR
jgi:hypothetical protein